MKCERWVFGAEGDGEHLRDVDGTDDEVESTLEDVKGVEEVGVLVGMCGASVSGKMASVSRGGRPGEWCGWAAGGGDHF